MSDLSEERALMASAEAMIRGALTFVSPGARMSALMAAFDSRADRGAREAFTMALIARVAIARRPLEEATIFDSAAMSRGCEELVDIVKGAEIKAQPDAPCGTLILIVEKPIAAELFHALMCQRDRHCARMGESLAWNPDEDERLRFLDGAIRLVQAQLFGPSPL